MLARIRKSIEEKDQGFTLIELLVVMIIIGILAAIAIPVFLSQRNKARDTATKSDVSTVGKTFASYYTDGTGGLNVAAGTGANAGKLVITSGTGASATTVDTVKASNGTQVVNFTGTTDSDWCVALKNSDSGKVFKYSAAGGLEAAGSTGC